MRNPTDKASNTIKFSEVCEACDVLSNQDRKAIYDKYGDYGFKEGIPDRKGEFVPGYRFTGNSFEIFEKFFGS